MFDYLPLPPAGSPGRAMAAPFATTTLFATAILFATATLFAPSARAEVDLRGSVGVETRYFNHGEEFQSSAFIEPEWYWEAGASAWKFKPFARVDALDEERSHGDIREAFYQYASAATELRVGINKIFWGVTESQHLVDVINQTDHLESLDGEDKLGQPMMQLTRLGDWGVLDAFLLPYFRERAFPGEDGHFNFSSRQLTEAGWRRFDAHMEPARYESSREERHLDAALRYSHTLGSWDFGVHYFSGTRRDPLLQVSGVDTSAGVIHFTPFYEQMEQLGVDVQATLGAWLWKLEALARRQASDDYAAAVAGFEYSFYGINQQGADLGWLVEFNWDERKEQASGFLQRDLFVGARLTWNDQQSSELLAGVIQDLEHSDRYLARLEASRRLGDAYRLSLETWIFHSDAPTDLMYSIRDEDFIQISLERFF